ncbi:MAG: universal stress protein [Chitinophagales bacterium]
MKLKIDKILVPTDFSPLSLSALHYAAALARHSNAEIILYHVIETYMQNTFLEEIINIDRIIEDAVNKKMEEIKSDNIDLWGIKITARIGKGKIYRQISDFQKTNNIDLIIMGTHGWKDVDLKQKHILGSNAIRVVSGTTVPVITFRTPIEEVRLKKIVLPLDITKETDQKVLSAMKLARVFDAEIHLVSISTYFDELRFKSSYLKEQLNNIADKVKDVGIPVQIKMIRHENVPKAIMDYSKEIDADLLMIMTQQEVSKSDFYNLGSSARKVIAESKVPVFSIRPER